MKNLEVAVEESCPTNANPPLIPFCISLNNGQHLQEEEGEEDLLPSVSVSGGVELPTIDLSRLRGVDAEECKKEIAEACSELGLFFIVNHGISKEVLEMVMEEEVAMFNQDFEKKNNNSDQMLGRLSAVYRWGSPSAKSIKELSWSEAYHIVREEEDQCNSEQRKSTRSRASIMEEFMNFTWNLSHELAKILADRLSLSEKKKKKKNQYKTMRRSYNESSSYLRLNHYIPCPNFDRLFGLIPHTDTDFLTIVYQDRVGGLQYFFGNNQRFAAAADDAGEWVDVSLHLCDQHPDALLVFVGDLCEAWSNGVYKSARHRVLSHKESERYSFAYFFCPTLDTVIDSDAVDPLYKKFTFLEYKKQVYRDTRNLGYKRGLSNFVQINM